ncbi:hypothetical protein AS156_14100 [Bradyrhizobium macuxiense]|uniref:Uncharacterized protein n=1 Tax=Bradyrhizobium macuxiense TaxID=1755647 RepID=A0A109JKV6_9BRAD|nr:hypothetical protein [Bradyrhizobium macuxiense]KWV50635.1 hypothetical protein AS156_14100 [Bradyrhizobium macuxiense]
MNITSPILAGTIRPPEFPTDSVTSLLTWPATGWFGDGLDGGLGMVMSGLAGVAAALLVTVVLSIYFCTGYRSTRDIVRHGLATALVLALLGLVAYDMRHDALAYFGLNASPAETGTNLPNTGLFGSRVIAPAPPVRWTQQLAI